MDSSHNLIQIIDEDYRFNENLQKQISSWENFIKSGFEYSIISILGPQSGGKSTLLNYLFDTSFPQMDPSTRSQTTKGLWLAYDPKKKCLIMDVEGTDSKERGEQHINFERKSALFSLVLSGILIINIWCHDVGRYSASNYDTLKTVFELHINLFCTPDSPKTLLLFCLRDRQLTPLEQLKRTLVEDLKAIWESDIKKPSHALNFAIEEYFIFKFVCLASYVFEKDEFIKEVSELRKSFEDPKDEGYLLSKAALTRIPADGFSEYAARVWEQIIDNKDLDLPTLKEMLATCRCDELMSEAVANFRIGAERLRDRLSQGVVVNTFLEETSELLVEAFQLYDGPASLYHEPVYISRRTALGEQTGEILEQLRTLQTRNIVDHETRAMEENISDTILYLMTEAPRDMWIKVSQEYSRLLDETSIRLKAHGKGTGLSDSAIETAFQDLKERARQLVQRKAKDCTLNLASTLVRIFEKSFKYDAADVPRSWGAGDNIPELYKAARDKALEYLALFSAMTLEYRDEGVKVELLSPAEILRVRNVFLHEIRPIYQECCQIRRQNMSLRSIPFWVYALVLVLGYNEFVYLFQMATNPLNFMLLLLAISIAVCFALLRKLRLLGVAEELARAALGEISEKARQLVYGDARAQLKEE